MQRFGKKYEQLLTKRNVLWVFIFFFFCISIRFFFPVPHTQFAANGSYLGMNVDMMNILPGTPYTIKTASGGDFFDQASQLGMNTIRIVDTQSNLGKGQYSQAQWQQVFSRAQQTNFHIILLTQNFSREQLLLGTYGLAKEQALWMIDVENEPDVCASLTGLQQEIAYAHQIAPGIPVTIGGWKCGNVWQNPSDLTKIINMVDIASPHSYGYTRALQNGTQPDVFAKQELTAIRQYAKGKPIIMEEWGGTNGMGLSSGPDINGTPQTQATIYQGVLKEVTAEQNQGVLGAVGWSYSTRQTGIPEDSDKDWAIVLNGGGQILPAAQAFTQYAHIVPSSSISPQPTGPTPTIQPGGTTFLLTLCPHGLGNCGDNVNANSGGNTNPKHTTRNVTLTILNNNGQSVGSGQGNVIYNTSSQNFQGNISFSNLSSGQYLTVVKLNGFLSKQVSGIVLVTQGQTTNLAAVSLVTGDVNNDNQLDILDYNIIIGCFGSKQNTSSCTIPPNTQASGADINDDGAVDGIDYNLFLRELSVQKGIGGTPTPTNTPVSPTALPTSSFPSPSAGPSGTKQTITAYGWTGSAAYQPAGSPWTVMNDAWGGPPPNTQSIDYYPNNFPSFTTLRWSYGGSGGNVLGYPEIVIGDQNDQAVKSANGVEPAWYGKTLGSLSRFIISWNITINSENGDNWDILFENHMNGHEVGIFLKDPGWPNVNAGTHFNNLGGISGFGVPNCWATGSFCIVPDGPLNGTPMLKGSIDLLPIFKWAISNGWMSSNMPIYGWESGVEPTNGSGSVTFNSLSVDIQ